MEPSAWSTNRMTESDLILAEVQASAARHLRWLMDGIKIVDGELVCSGWALSPLHPPEDVHFLINGAPFWHVEWPIRSSHLAKHFDYVPGAEMGNFVCRQPVK